MGMLAGFLQFYQKKFFAQVVFDRHCWDYLEIQVLTLTGMEACRQDCCALFWILISYVVSTIK